MRKFITDMKNSYFATNTGPRAAALAYYLLFSIFPVVGFFNIILSAFDNRVFHALEYLPPFTADILSMYTQYVQTYPGVEFLSAIMVAFLYMPYRAMKFVLTDIRRVYKIETNLGFLKKNIFILIFTIIFLIGIVVTGFFMVVSSEFLTFLLGDTMGGLIKYFIPVSIMFVLLVFLYKTGSRRPLKFVYKGALVSAVLWNIGSVIFSFYVNTLAKYSIVYGSLGTLMAFMVWIYFTCFCILVGVRINSVLDIEVWLKYN